MRYVFSALSLCVFALFHLSQGNNKVIFISLDGFRYDYLDMARQKGRNISAFEELRSRGFQADVQNVMLTLTFPSHYAMATGRYVENHGLVGNHFHDPTDGAEYYYTNNYNNIQSKWFEYAGAEPLWATNERHGHRTCVFQWVGSEARVQNRMAFASAGVYNTIYSLSWRMDRILDWISRDEFNLAMLYYNQPDSAGHRYGPDSEEVMNAVETTNDGIAYLLRRIEEIPSLNGKVNIIISSDHGMAQTNETHWIVNVYEALKDIPVLMDESPASLGLWPINGSTIENITTAIKNITNQEGFKMYLKDEIPDDYHFKNNYRIAPIYLIAELGWMFQTDAAGYNNLSKFVDYSIIFISPSFHQLN